MSADSTEQPRRLKELSAAEYSRLSGLLDSCLALSAEQRARWLSQLELKDSASAAIIRRLFATSNSSGQEALLKTGEVLTRHLASLAKSGEALAGKRVGPYHVLSLLGQGGMGSVWLAERADGLFSRQVALKLVHPMLMGLQVTERFARERQILAGLSHPNIARLFDAGFTDDGRPFLVLEYVTGSPINTYCDERQLTLRQRLALFLQVLSAVQYAHTHLIIHRDLKPSNILVTREGEARLLDFGIAKLLTEGDARETELTQLGGRALTPDYAAPEQIVGGPVSTAADVYSLGVILYELLTGERPYRLKRDSRGALEEAILAADPVAPSRVVPSEAATLARASTARRMVKTLKGDLDVIVGRALKKVPAERYPTVNSLSEDIARFLRGDTVLAQRDSLAYRIRKFTRRHRVGIATVSILIVTLAGGLAATTYEARIAGSERDAALRAQMRALTQAAALRLDNSDASAALSIVLELLRPGSNVQYAPEAINVLQEAQAADAQLFALTAHKDRVTSATFSPDGYRLLTSSDDRTARIWDAFSGSESLLLPHADRVTAAAFSPDGRYIVTASHDKNARIFDAVTGRQLVVLQGHTEPVWSVAFSPEGRRVVSSSDDKTARIWDVASGKQILQLAGHSDSLESAMFSPDGQRVVTASDDKSARIWDAATARQVALLMGPDRVWFAAFSPDGRRVVTASEDKTARIWDAMTGQQVSVLSGHSGRVISAVFSDDGLRILTASEDKTIRIWDAATARQVQLLRGHADRVISAQFSPNGRQIVSASDDKTARLWRAGERDDGVMLRGHTDKVETATFSADGLRIVTASDDKTARIWKVRTAKQIASLVGHTEGVWCAAFSPDGSRVITASLDKTARIWDSASARELMRLTGHTGSVLSAAFSPDAQFAVTASADGTARVWNTATGRPTLILKGHTDRVWSAAFSPNGREIVTASADKTARIWNSATGQQTLLLSGDMDRLWSARFSPDGSQVITTSDDGTARTWELASGRQLMIFRGHSDRVWSADFSPDGRRIVTASDDQTTRIWDAMTGQQIALLRGHADRVLSARFSPDGRRMVTTSSDGTAGIWDLHISPLEVQLAWAKAAQFDWLREKDRFELGLPVSGDVRTRAAEGSKCDEVAAAPYDPDRLAPGVTADKLIPDIAVVACGGGRTGGRGLYQRARALIASGQFVEARRDLENALGQGYRAARVDLGMLLSQPTAGMIDVPKVRSLYEQAWQDGVAIAAFELGSLYEHGVRLDATNEYVVAPDEKLAWTWYRKGADAGEPSALARLGEMADQTALAETDPAKRKEHLLESFGYYAAAAEQARTEDWPDDAWRNWRYRRASLARLLAREGMTVEVADVYERIRRQYSPRAQSVWERLLSLAGVDGRR